MSKEVYNAKSECCGCGACMNICPKKAITLEEDEYGFIHPKIDKSKCIDCKLCEKVCLYKSAIELENPKTCYAGSTDNEKICRNSASGGIFYTIALDCIKKNFICYGSYMNFKNSKPIVEHIRIESESDLVKLQGSKYVQSDISKVYNKIKEDLLNNKKVLFSGTPCQVQAVRMYLSNIKAENIEKFYTIDIICHGVPPIEFFSKYIDSLYKNYEKVNFKFRDKTEGWGLMASITLKKGNKEIKKRVYPKTSSYYHSFLNMDIYRESCYNCKFATKKRTGDITVGDYWGIEKLHPEYLKENGGKLNIQNGVSCILINTEKGFELFNQSSDKILFEPTSFENISKYNHNLNKPSYKGNNRDKVLELYKKNKDFSLINRWYKKKLGIKYYIYNIWIRLPYCIRKKIRKKVNK